MGYGYEYRCTCCGKRGTIIFGIGGLYAAEMDWFRELCLEGKRGSRLKKLAQEHPGLIEDGRMVVYRCTCGKWRNTSVGDCYIAADGEEELDPFFLISGENTAAAKRIYRKRHRCPSCGREMKRYRFSLRAKLACPRCGGRLEFNPMQIRWD